MTIKPIAAWFDCWIGAYWDRKTRSLYILPIPCVGVVMQFAPKTPECCDVSVTDKHAPGWWCSRERGHNGPCAAHRGPRVSGPSR